MKISGLALFRTRVILVKEKCTQLNGIHLSVIEMSRFILALHHDCKIFLIREKNDF